MQERQVTIEGETQPLPYPFLVIATQSPVGFHREFPLPEMLVDRFLLNLRVGYPSLEEELEITDRLHSIEVGEVRQVTTAEQISNLVELAKLHPTTNIVWSPHFYQLAFASKYYPQNFTLLELDFEAKYKTFLVGLGAPMWIGEF